MEIADQLPERYSLSTPYNDTDNIHAYSKVNDLHTLLIEFPDSKRINSHIYIDIFPIDGMPNEPIAQERHRLKCRRRMLLMYAFRVAKFKQFEGKTMKSLFWKTLEMMQKYVIKNRLAGYVDKACLKYDFDSSKYCSETIAGYGFRETMPAVVYQFDKKIKFRTESFIYFVILNTILLVYTGII